MDWTLLLIAVLVGIILGAFGKAVVSRYFGGPPSENPKTESQEKIQWRKNVLATLVLAYGSVLGVLGLMLGFGADPLSAFNVVSVPFVALVGGTLAVTKDLLG